MDKSAREAGRTFEGMLLFMAAAVAAAVVFPAVFGPPQPVTDPEATCLVALAGLASGKADPGATRCPVADQPYARAGSAPETAEPDGAEATPAAAETFRCPDPKHHLGETGLHAERTGAAWALVQDLPDPTELTATEQPLGSSGLLLTRTVRRDPDAVRFLTRPNLGLRVIVTLLLLGLSLHVGYTVTIENYSGWRPGGTPPMPSRPVFAFQVLVATLLNPLAWGAIALAVGLGPVRTVPLGAERPLAVVALTGDPAAPRLVALRPAGEGDGFEATDLIRLGPNDLGVARAVADLVAAAAAPPAPEAPEPAQPEGR